MTLPQCGNTVVASDTAMLMSSGDGMVRTEMGHKCLKFSFVKEWPTQVAHANRAIIHSRAHTKANIFRADVRKTSLVLSRCTTNGIEGPGGEGGGRFAENFARG